MALNPSIVAEFLIACVLLTGGLAIIGFPIRALLLDGSGVRSPVPSVVAGMAVVQLVGWYWLRAGGEGMRTPTIVLLACGAVGTGVVLVRRGVPRPSRADLPAWVAGTGAVIVFVVVYASVLDLPFHTTATLGNNDAISYAVAGQHLAQHGFADPGQVTGFSIGDQSKRDAFGASAVLAAGSDATGIDTWKLTTSLMFIFVVLGAVSLARLLAELFPDAPVQSGLAAVAAGSGYLFLYIVGQFFLAQVMTMALVPIVGVIALRARDGASVRAIARMAGSFAIVVLVFAATYLQMLVPVMALVAPGAVVVSWREYRSALPRIVAVLGAGAVVAALVAPDLVIQGIKRARELSTAQAGWSLPGFLPSEIAGALNRPAATPHGTGGWAASAMLLAGFAAALIALRRTRARAALYAVATVTLILVSYLIVFWHEGGASYRQWKWITFFEPVFAALVFMVVWMALTDRAVIHRLRGAVAVSCVGLAGLAAVILAVSGFAHTPLRGPLAVPPPGDSLTYADPALSNLAVNPKLARLHALNVNLSPFWDTMWAVYFLRGHQLSLQSAAYYPPSPATARWTLTERTPGLTSPSFRIVNERFQLEPRFTGTTSATAAGLGARITSDPTKIVAIQGAPIQLTATITNTGSSAWLPGGTTPGSVNLGSHLETPSGKPIVFDFSRQAPSPARTAPIPPGTTATTVVSLTAPAPGHYRLSLQMVSEGVEWFGPATPVDLTVQASG